VDTQFFRGRRSVASVSFQSTGDEITLNFFENSKILFFRDLGTGWRLYLLAA